MTYDLLIKNGTVVDGSGNPGYRADVAVSGGKIAAIGRINERAKQTIDAEGHIVSPGFVDGHTHMDAQIFWDPIGSCSYHGVTSVVMGNCGFTLAPCKQEDADMVFRNLERAEDLSRRPCWRVSTGAGRPFRNFWMLLTSYPRASITPATLVIRRYAPMLWASALFPTPQAKTMCDTCSIW